MTGFSPVGDGGGKFYFRTGRHGRITKSHLQKMLADLYMNHQQKFSCHFHKFLYIALTFAATIYRF